MSATLRAARRRANPIDYVDGVALGKVLRDPGPWPKPPPRGNTGPPIYIPGGRRSRVSRYSKGRGHPD